MVAKRSGMAAALAVAACLILTSCSALHGDAPRTVRATADSTPGLERFYRQQPQWGPCDGFSAAPLSPAMSCAKISAPLDYADPDGTTLKLAISRIMANRERLGMLLFIPGGPGDPGVEFADTGAGTDLDRFDRIGFDPRGTGASEPLVDCPAPASADPRDVPGTERAHRNYAEECLRRSGRQLLAHVGTRETVQDIELIRRVLGADTLNAVGYSYGTRYGAAYATKYPDRVRAMVLDGAVPFDEDPVTDTVLTAAAMQRTFDEYARSCAAQPDCPLGSDPAQASTRFRELTAPLRDRPLPSVEKPAEVLDYQTAIGAVTSALYDQEEWASLSEQLRGLRAGNPDPILGTAPSGSGKQAGESTGDTALTAVNCVDYAPLRNRATVARLDAEKRRAAPFLDPGEATAQVPLDVCAFWPVPPTTTRHALTTRQLPPLVVVSTTNDPATPHEHGIRLAQQLRASLITYRNSSHTVALLRDVACVDRPVIDYLVTLRVPSPGLMC